MHHITAKGEIALCRAKVRACPLEGEHGTRSELEQALTAGYTPLPPTIQKHRYELPPSEPLPSDWLPEELAFWEKVREHLGVYVHQRRAYVPSSRIGSVYFCFTCYRRLPHSEAYSQVNWEVLCECGAKVQDGLAGITLKAGVEKFFHSPAVLEEEWYHYTAHPTWETFLAPANAAARVVHLGTREAALDRQHHTQNRAGALYRLRIRSDAQVAEEILDEDPFNQMDAPLVSSGGVQKGVLVSGVTRYLNSYEDPGSMSLIANPRLLEVVEATAAPKRS